VPGTNLTRGEAADRAAILDVSDYTVALDLGVDDVVFRTTTEVTFTCRTPGASSFIDLISPAVHQVTLNGRSLAVPDVVSPGRIGLDDLAEHNHLTVVADGAYMHTGEGLHRFVDPVDKEVYLYSQFEVADARRVFACFDQPDLKATFQFSVTAPAHWQVVSVSPTPTPQPHGPGTSTWHFAATPRLSTYVTALVAGPYHAYRGELTSRDGRVVPLGVFCRQSLAEHLDGEAILDVTRIGFDWFESIFDVPYPFEKYDQLFVPEFNAGAMENAGAVTITEHYVFRSKVPEAAVERRGLTLLHELAHMWFGDLVTMQWWDDLWLNESFAEHASTRCQAEATGWGTAWTTFSIAEKSWAYRQDQLASTHPIVADIRDLADVEVNFDGITYAKGASVLKQLVAWVGQDAFDEGVRSYFRRHAWQNTTLTDLLAELEATSGRDLDAWARSWLQTAGVTTLRPQVQTGPDGLITALEVVQEAPADYPHLRPHRLAVSGYDLVDGRLTRTSRVELDVAGERTAVPELVGLPRPALLLVNDDDLAYAKIRLDEQSLATATQHLSSFDDSLARTLVWGSAWDMTRDAEMSARAFVELVLGNIASVDDPSVAQTLLRQLSATLLQYVAPEFWRPTAESAADRLLALLGQAPIGSDMQLLLARSFAQHAMTPTHLAVVSALLSGERVIDGLTVDTDMRWVLLGSLVAGGLAGADDIERELDRDDTASGRVQAAGARAAIPTPEGKAAAWRSVVDQDGMPNAVQAAVIGGFTRTHDTRLLAGYMAPYFEAISRVWKERTSEMATQIVVGLYPSARLGPEVIERTDEWLAVADPEPSLRRLVLEGRDGVERALRVQERDRSAG
jgi:aminopeptidase N